MTFKYYLLGESVPIRVTFNDLGHKIGAEVPDKNTGALLQKTTYLSRLEQSFEVIEMTADDFNRHCRLIWGG